MKRDVYLDDKPWQEALEEYIHYLTELDALKPGQAEMISTEDALARVTAEPIYASNSSPHYHASAMDGVAVRSLDTFGASETTPKQLKMGEQALMVDTGDPVPEGYDAVIMIEDVHFINEELIEIISAAAPWQHVRVIGEDVVSTEMILPANHLIRPVDIGGILAGGITRIAVHPRPRVAVMPTGTELVQPDNDNLKPGDIIEYNTRVLGSYIRQWGGQPFLWEITKDDYNLLKNQILKAADEADMVVINAGSSAGREDFTVDLIRELGKVLTHGVATKPGKPVILGEIKGKPVIGVPGYPVSAALCCQLFVKPLVYKKLGAVPPEQPTIKAAISRKLVTPLGVEEFVRVKLGRVNDKTIATPISRGAGVIMSMVRADGILRVPRNSEGYQAGDIVDIELMRPMEEVNETTVIIGSHDNTLDVLANFLRQQYPEAALSSAHVGSLGGLTALKRRETHCAGAHLLDEETGQYNISYIKRLLPDRDIILVNLVYREQGLIIAKGNPKNINNLSDLTKQGVSFVNRQRGAGTRILLDYKLKELGIGAKDIHGYQHEEYTHMSVAAAVAGGSADAGLGIKAAAKALDLDFIPVVEERYDLCIPAEYWDEPVIQRLLKVMALPDFQQQVKGLGGYDLRDCGKVMWQSGDKQ
ncbi:MAG: molybdopterin biosynthesis protein [Firmicutes bacterium]|nr:molybdopterin biosynthesis protein [Bacillota bacterium]